ncbi:MAG TPA: GNAT family N-acetyltransferase [Cyclobacteriaceae bacterium]|nr:GNAT family N-acetyltransferase [Cyclobacteriaceae bacterium]
MPTEIIVRQMTEADFDAAMEIKNAEGWNQTLRDWELIFSESPEFCLVAVKDATVVGTVTAIVHEKKLAWIGMMLVRKPFRGMGIGQLLMKSILQKLEPCPSIKLDATPAGFPVYSKLGFEEEYLLNRMTRSPINQSYPDRQDFPIRPAVPEDLQAIADFDQEIFGVRRESVIGHMLASEPNVSIVLEDENKIKGYLLGRPGTNYYQLGPLVSTVPESLHHLLTHALNRLKNQTVVVDVYQDKENLIHWLQAQGFAVQREFIRMYIGHNPYPGNVQLQYLISGPELG